MRLCFLIVALVMVVCASLTPVRTEPVLYLPAQSKPARRPTTLPAKLRAELRAEPTTRPVAPLK